jgi:hypothetical protein
MMHDEPMTPLLSGRSERIPHHPSGLATQLLGQGLPSCDTRRLCTQVRTAAENAHFHNELADLTGNVSPT